jgi:cytoskeleton protein RodZ
MAVERTAGDFGGRLREARERRGIPLRQIANATKISVGVLEALERNDISRLPGGIFGRAFVRSYAVEVGLDPERTIQEFIGQFPHDSITAGHPSSRQVETHVSLLDTRPPASAVLAVVAVAILIAAGAVRFDVWSILSSYTEPLWTIQNWRLPALARRDEPRSGLVVNSDPFRADAPTRVGVPTPPASDATPPEPAPVPEPTATDGSDDRLTVRLSVLRPCWVSATVDGRKAIERLLQIGEEQTINVHREIVLTAADAGALALTLNGDRAKPLGNLGEVVTARLNLTNFREFLAR